MKEAKLGALHLYTYVMELGNISCLAEGLWRVLEVKRRVMRVCTGPNAQDIPKRTQVEK